MIKDIIENNSYPIVFIGSGMSKRYLENFPTWSNLLEEYWEQLNENQNIYQYMRNLEQNDDEIKSTLEDKRQFLINIKTASYIKKQYDDLFYSNKITLDGLTIQEAYVNKISPFNFSITKRFSEYTIKEEMKEELEEYKIFLSKAKVIVTTNYDTLTEDLLESINQKPTIYVGQKGFFDETFNWSELFKIHGDVNDPSSIVITEEDYNSYDKNSILISAKILSNLINSPIIFIGYSLSDRNVQKLLTDFASQLPNDDLRKNTNRITVVEYHEDIDVFDELIINNPSINISHSILKTNNYLRLFQEIGKINQGLTPYEVSKFESAIKKIVVTFGEKGELDNFLVSAENLDTLPEDIQKRRIIVALGDKKNMFVNPDFIDYVEDYFKDGATFLPEVALRFIANENTQTRIPLVKYLKNVDLNKYSFLSPKEIEKIERRISIMGKLDNLIDSIPKAYQKEYDKIEDILRLSSPKLAKLELITYNINKFSVDSVLDFINSNILPNLRESYFNRVSDLSAQRRLLLAYDLLKNGDII
ncbi:Contig000036, whole genome shotgun sequence [Streptococcus oralis subsp. tigurinus]|uniref:Contig000036, whole genome shotgun sequence n=1 Tax=Streptococcus oralis subsp. tigurinus TaxID=1077464 RepID=A0A224A401_STROR|nr:SIR2 family protein [Streptococcus oralis]BBA07660.1 Contig000036, whole genome shotgun sequence [Streptococcus oralis subsp. tigurinus]